jgi:hypothetical protein
MVGHITCIAARNKKGPKMMCMLYISTSIAFIFPHPKKKREKGNRRNKTNLKKHTCTSFFPAHSFFLPCLLLITTTTTTKRDYKNSKEKHQKEEALYMNKKEHVLVCVCVCAFACGVGCIEILCQV